MSSLLQSNKDQIESFRKQELERYKNPTKPFVFICSDGMQAVVIIKFLKINFHQALKNILKNHIKINKCRYFNLTIFQHFLLKLINLKKIKYPSL
jgi:hypothetical protein